MSSKRRNNKLSPASKRLPSQRRAHAPHCSQKNITFNTGLSSSKSYLQYVASGDASTETRGDHAEEDESAGDLLQSTHNVVERSDTNESTKDFNVVERSDNNEESTKDLPMVEGDNALNETSTRARVLLQELRIDVERVLLGAAWVDEDGYQQFLQFPEVFFVDATHKTNNEGPPLLLIYGRDFNGNAFIIVRVYMPNETAAFYLWVFLKCLPALLGKDNLCRVRLIITDGDAHEFDAVDEAIFVHFPNGLRARCKYHVVQKNFEKSGINELSMPQPDAARIMICDK